MDTFQTEKGLCGLSYMTKLYITRHGQTKWNLANKIQGWADSPLTAIGKKQAHWLKEKMKDQPLDVIFTSSAERALRTAEIIRDTKTIPIFPCDFLKEMSMGSWEGKSFNEMKESFPELYTAYWKNPHLYQAVTGESYYEVKDRVIPKIKELLSHYKGKNILIVTHTVTLKLIMAYFENRPLEKLWDPPYIHEASLSLVEIKNKKHIIHLHADISHYQEDLQYFVDAPFVKL